MQVEQVLASADIASRRALSRSDVGQRVLHGRPLPQALAAFGGSLEPTKLLLARFVVSDLH